VVGVVKDARSTTVRDEVLPSDHGPFVQMVGGAYAVRTTGGPHALIPSIREAALQVRVIGAW
jgi:hypothetical protein